LVTTRRRFIEQSALAAAGAAASVFVREARAHPMVPSAARAIPNLDPNSLAKFVDPLPLPAIAVPTGHRSSPGSPGGRLPAYRVAARAVTQRLHRDLPATPLWAYGGSVPGVMFDVRAGEGVLIEWANELPSKHFLPIDHTLHGAEPGVPEGRTVVHVHGAKAPPESDGYPEDWYVPGQSRLYHYPNDQPAALLWYHDHAMGINRLNMYAGLFGLYVIRDAHEQALGLPSGKYEIPLVLFDRDARADGQLSYPVSADPERPWVPEVFGELHLVNGKIAPYLEVEPRRYRLRILNAANGRFYRLSVPDGVDLFQIGTDQGLLSAPIAVKHVLLAPAERADLLIDFAPHRGARIELASDAFALMQFRVGEQAVPDPGEMPRALSSLERLAESAAVKTRRLTLDESQNLVAESTGMLLNKTPWHMPITEKPVLGTTEIWEIVNLTDDTHPIHLHLVRFQILDRRRFDAFQYMTQNTLRYVGPVMPPDPNELGWKDTVRVNAKTVTRIIVPFSGYVGRYVWHCHILEHEDNEMMRPYEVVRA
jgi:spore coat protein A, manganese oxidase